MFLISANKRFHSLIHIGSIHIDQHNNQVYSQPNAEYKLNNTTDNKNDKKN